MGDFTAVGKSNEQVISERKTARGKKIYNKVFEGGKKPAAKKPAAKKPTTKKPTYSEKFLTKKNIDPSYMDDFITKKYKASKSGKVSTSTRKHYEAPTYGGGSRGFVDVKRKSIDTTGYAAGKPFYILKTENKPEIAVGKSLYKKSTKMISRKDIPKTLESMKKGTGMKQKEAAQKKKKTTSKKK